MDELDSWLLYIGFLLLCSPKLVSSGKLLELLLYVAFLEAVEFDWLSAASHGTL